MLFSCPVLGKMSKTGILQHYLLSTLSWGTRWGWAVGWGFYKSMKLKIYSVALGILPWQCLLYSEHPKRDGQQTLYSAAIFKIFWTNTASFLLPWLTRGCIQACRKCSGNTLESWRRLANTSARLSQIFGMSSSKSSAYCRNSAIL